MNELINLWWLVIIVLVLISGLSLCFPVFLIKLTRVGARQFDMQADKLLNKSLSVDRIFYRHHLIAGLLICLLSASTLYLLLFKLNLSPTSLQASANPFGWQPWLFDVAMTLALVSGIAGCCFGMVLTLRPSLLKPLEFWGNRWITTPEGALDKDITGEIVDNWVIQHTRLFGLLVFLAAFVIWLLVFEMN